MYKVVNGKRVEMTQEEIAEMQKQNALYNAQSKYVQKSSTEVMDMFVRQNIQTLSVTDDEALCMKQFYPTWDEVSKLKQLKKGFKFTYKGELWEVVQTHSPQSIYPPSVNTASLYKHIVETYEGTEDEPIPYKPPMELFSGKVYTDGVELYKCTRDSGNPLSYELKELVGLYVEKI